MILSYLYIDTLGVSKDELRQRQSAMSKKLLSSMLAKCGISDNEIIRDEMGRPYLAAHPDVDFNISHSGNIVVCALSVGEGRVGVDVERINGSIPKIREENFKKRFFSPKEIESGIDISSAWTKKEAYLKYLGIGLRTDLRSLNPDDDKNVRFERIEIGEYTVAVCLGRDVRSCSVLAVASKE